MMDIPWPHAQETSAFVCIQIDAMNVNGRRNADATQDNHGRTAAYRAARRGHTKVLKFLIEVSVVE